MDAHEKGIEAGIESSGMAGWDHIEERATDFLKAYLSASGMVMVPEVPTEEMRTAWNCSPGNGSSYFFDAYYADMVSAAPKPFKDK